MKRKGLYLVELTTEFPRLLVYGSTQRNAENNFLNELRKVLVSRKPEPSELVTLGAANYLVREAGCLRQLQNTDVTPDRENSTIDMFTPLANDQPLQEEVTCTKVARRALGELSEKRQRRIPMAAKKSKGKKGKGAKAPY